MMYSSYEYWRLIKFLGQIQQDCKLVLDVLNISALALRQVLQQQPVGSEVTFMGQCVHVMLGRGWLNANRQ